MYQRFFDGRAYGLAALILLVLIPLTNQPLEAKSPLLGKKKGTQAEEAKKAGKEGDEEKEKWDVAAPPQPTYEIEIDTDEGTWMSVDVSPDGETIVFDLLGDVYTVGIEGGEAKALTQGLPWDMQPRFSPDGTSIAFTSDRAGGDNIWVMDADGANPRAVSDEDFRLLNSPAWTPDGQFIAARKHFTSSRSLGAGEIWLYHRSGGKGLQMTEKPNDQKDVGEPAFSPDGNYLYFSRDVTPGGTFQYNKDSNTEIYAIRRLNRQTGDIETLIGGPGGSIRPTPSPDGRTLAFVRRVRFKTVLFLYDLESGKETALFDGLDRDMQETWAVHGVYPAMAWTPDGTSIVLWGGGKIQRVHVADRQVEEIPFHVRAKHTMIEGLRSQREIAPKTFETKMLRWIQVSPAGDRAVFQALGRLYVRDLPDGEPRLLTDQAGADEQWEYYPSFSRDGRWIVYTTWDDEKLGSVRVVAASGGTPRILVEEPGHYVEPVISPDGETVVYRKIQGGWLRSPLWSNDPGLYRIPFAGSAVSGGPERIRAEGNRPHFGADPKRVYFRVADEDHRILTSVELDGSDERKHVSTEWASDFRVSPDGQWIAFVERFHVYVAPMPTTGRPIELGPDGKNLPIRRLTRDAGDDLHWSGDSTKLHWSLGPQLFEQELPKVFAFLGGSSNKAGASDEEAKPPTEGIGLGFTVERPVPAGRMAFVGGQILTMNGDTIFEDGTVVVDGEKIVAVGPRAEVEVPADAKVFQLEGRTLMPGLVDVHWHGSQGSDEFIPQQNWNNYASLAFGVTTLHDPSNDTSEIFAAAELARAGAIVAPRIFSTGTILYGAKTIFTAEVTTLEDARTHLRRTHAAGAFSVKSYNQPRRDQRQKMIAAARELDMLVMPEGGSLLQHNLTMVADGHSGIEHSIPVAKIYDDVRQFWSKSSTAYTPTLVVGYGGIWGENYFYEHTNVWENERLLSFVPRRLVDERSRRRTMAPPEEYNHISNATAATELARLGVDVTVGAHGQREGLGAHWEIWSFVLGGMTPLEALQAGTISGARYLGMDGQIGSIEVGKLADLMVIDGNPLEDIRSSENVRWVMVGGRLYDAATMNQVAPVEKARRPFFFEGEGGMSAGGILEAPATATCSH